MSWAQTLATGRGELSFRLKIERLATEFVSHPSMSSQARRSGLALTSRWKCVTNPATGDVDVSPLGLTVLGSKGTDIFARRPSLTTWLTADCTSTEVASITVRSTNGWPSEGVIWVDSEAIGYEAITGTSFDTLTRGLYGTAAQAHYVDTGGTERYPEITDRAVTYAGARAWVYVYGQHDDPQGNGTLYFAGFLSRDPSFDGVRWSFSVEPLTTLLARTLSSDLASPRAPRGIYYPANRPLQRWFDYGGTRYEVALYGFFENNTEFVAAFNASVTASGLDATGHIVRAIADGDVSWHLEVKTPNPVTDIVTVVQDEARDDVDPFFGAEAYSGGELWRGLPTVTPVAPDEPGVNGIAAQSNNTTYYWMPRSSSLPGAGSVPRGYWGIAALATPALAATYPVTRIYLDGGVGVLGLSGVKIRWPALGTWQSEEMQGSIVASSTATNYIETTAVMAGSRSSLTFHGFTAAALPDISFGRMYLGAGTGNLGDLLEAICDAVPDGLNAGAVPALRTTDFESLPDIFPTVFDRIVNSRLYGSWGEADLMEIAKAECQLAGYGIGTTAAGLIRFFELVPPVGGGDPALLDAFFGRRTVIEHPAVDRAAPSWQPVAHGLANQVLLKRGYSISEDDYKIGSITVKDVSAFGQSPRPRTISIEPKSALVSPETAPEVVERAQRLFALLAAPYASIVLDADLRFWPIQHGDTVYITSPQIPDVNTGSMGVTDLPALVVGREVDRHVVRLTCIAQGSAFAAYVPEFFITAETNVSGNTWDITINPTVDGVTYPLTAFYADGYEIRVWRWDDTTSATTAGTVSLVTDTTARVALSGAATLNTGTWVLSFARSDEVDTAQLTLAFVAKEQGISVVSGYIPHKVFA